MLSAAWKSHGKQFWHYSRIPYAPYSCRVKIKVRIRIKDRIRVMVRIKVRWLGIRGRVRVYSVYYNRGILHFLFSRHGIVIDFFLK